MNTPGRVQVVRHDVLQLAFVRHESLFEDLDMSICGLLDRSGRFFFHCSEAKEIGLEHGLFQGWLWLKIEEHNDLKNSYSCIIRFAVERSHARVENYDRFNGLMEVTLPGMQGSVEFRGIRPAPVYYGSNIYESTTDETGMSFEEERIRQRIQEKALQPFSAAYQAPVACSNETNMTNLVNMVDKQRWLNNVHQTLSRPGIKMNSLPCIFQERTQNSYLDDLIVDKEMVIHVDIMSMFSPQALRRNVSFGQHWDSCSEAHLHHDGAATLHTRDFVSFRQDGNTSSTYAVNDVAPEDAKDVQCIYISDEEVIDTRKSKKQRVYPTPISSDEGLGVKDCAGSSCGTTLQRKFMEPGLPEIEYRKPGGKVYPWDRALTEEFLTNLDPPLSDYKGYIHSSKKYSGKVSLRSLLSNKSAVRNRLKDTALQLGCRDYQLKSYAGQGAFGRVYMAEAVDTTGDRQRVVLKVQKPACPWEFYAYRQLDMRVPSEERCTFGRAQNIHIYADCSFMECDLGQYGTLQDVINTHLSKGRQMDEVLCIFYTIEMLRMLENLHKVGLIHGDFKPDNLLVRCSSEYLGRWAPDKPGSWKQQGVCLIDWGRSIDFSLFAEGTEFVGDCKTEGFRSTEMIAKKPWTFQVDTYGLCGVVHCLLHGSYLEIDNRSTSATSHVINRPKAPYKRYWNVCLWQYFFETLLNLTTSRSCDTLNHLRGAFETFLRSDLGLMEKLRELLVKQNTSLLSSL